MSTVNAIVNILKEKGGFVSEKPPIYIEDAKDLSFEFDSVLAGPKGGRGLVVIADSSSTDLNVLLRQIRSLSLVLGRINSRRTLTCIIVTEKVGDGLLEKIGEYCRLLVIKPSDDLGSSLLSILPLKLPDPEEIRVSFDELIKNELGNEYSSELYNKLLSIAGSDPETIEEFVVDRMNDMAKKGIES